MSTRVWGMLYVLSVLWGASYLYNRIAIAEMPPVTLVFLRMALAALVLIGVVRMSGLSMPRDVRSWRDLAVMGSLNGIVPFILIVWAQKTIDPGLTAILGALTPIFGVVFAHFVTRDEKATFNKVVGVVLGVAGVVILLGVGALTQAGTHLLAELAVVGASALYALSAIWSRRFRGHPPVVTAAGQMSSAAVMLLPVSLLVDHPWTLAVPSAPAILSILALALLSTAAAYVLFFRIVTAAGASNVMLVTLLIPANAVILSYVFLGKTLTPDQFAGMAIIGLGLICIDGRALRAFRARQAG